MISFDTKSHRFHLRAAAVIERDGAFLLHRAEGDAFWALPGGRVEAGEPAASAVARELREELTVSVTVGELLLVVENFFVHGGRQNHEVGLYFATTVEPGCRLATSKGPYSGSEGTTALTFAWFTPVELRKIQLRPSFLAAELALPKLRFRHIVHHGENAL